MRRLDIVLPVYNPLPGWEETVIARIGSLRRALPGRTVSMIVVNDGTPGLGASPAWQRLAAAEPAAIMTGYSDNRGKGFALRFGVRQATGDIILYTDIDWPYTEDSMLRVISALEQDADAVIGIRDAGYYRHLPPARRWISKMLRQFNGLLLRLKVNDTQAGLKGFRRPLARIFTETTIDRYLFDLEFVYRLSRMNGIRIEACPIELRPGISFSTMNRTILWQEARNFLRIWLRGKASDSGHPA